MGDSRWQRLPYWLGGGVMVVLVITAIFAPWLAPYPLEQVDLNEGGLVQISLNVTIAD